MEAKEMEAIRKQLGWSKREMAKRFCVNERTVHGWLRGEHEISKQVEKIAKIYAGGYIEKEE